MKYTGRDNETMGKGHELQKSRCGNFQRKENEKKRHSTQNNLATMQSACETCRNIAKKFITENW